MSGNDSDTPMADSTDFRGGSLSPKAEREPSPNPFIARPTHAAPRKAARTSDVTKDYPFPPGEVVWSKLKGFGWWPSVMADETRMTQRQIAGKVGVTRMKGNRVIRMYPVFFLQSLDYGWVTGDCLHDFQQYLKAYSRLSTSKDFRQALSEALEPGTARGLYEESMQANDEYNEHMGFVPGAKKAHRGGRNHDDEDDEEEDEGEDNHDRKPHPKVSKSSVKKENSGDRKVGRAISDDEEDAPVKKAVRKRKLSEIAKPGKTGAGKGSSDRSGSGDASHAPSSLPLASRKSGSHEGGSASGDKGANGSGSRQVKLSATDPQDRLMYLRHRLQRSLLKPENPLPAEDLKKCDAYMRDVENFPVTLEMLRETKIAKLMKRVALNTFVGDTYDLAERSKLLVTKWHALLGGSAPVSGNGAVHVKGEEEGGIKVPEGTSANGSKKAQGDGNASAPRSPVTEEAAVVEAAESVHTSVDEESGH